MFARYIENRPSIEETAKKTKDPVDIALADHCRIIGRLRELRKLRAKHYDDDHLTPSNEEEISQWYERVYQHEEEISRLESRLITVFEECAEAIDQHPDWIWRFNSPAGEAFLKTSQDAVDLEAKFEARGPRGGLYRGKKLKEWKETCMRRLLCRLEPIKLGVDGGTCRLYSV